MTCPPPSTRTPIQPTHLHASPPHALHPREINYRVVKIRITDIVSNTYYARVHLARVNAITGQPDPDSEVDVDARPSDAINLAVRFGSPMFVSKRIADAAAQPYPEQQELKGAAGAGGAVVITGGGESASEIVRSVREAISSYEDPTSRAGAGRGPWPTTGSISNCTPLRQRAERP